MSRLIAMTTILLVLAGCASPPLPPAEAPEAEPSPAVAAPPKPPADEPVVSVPNAPASPAQPASPVFSEPAPVVPAAGGPELPAGVHVVWIESEPAGATVVVDGRPVGQTPLQLTFPGTARGFFRAEASIRVRFIAGDATEVSSSVEEVFTTLDRIPARIVFTAAGARRVW